MKRIIPIPFILFIVLGFIQCSDLRSEISLHSKSIILNTNDKVKEVDSDFNLQKIEKNDSENHSKQEKRRKKRGINLSVFYLLNEYTYLGNFIEKLVILYLKEIYFSGLFISNEKRGPPTFSQPI